MTDADRLADYINEILGGRTIVSKLRETLHQLLEVPRIRERFPTLTTDTIRAVADRFVMDEEAEEAKPKRRRRRWTA